MEESLLFRREGRRFEGRKGEGREVKGGEFGREKNQLSFDRPMRLTNCEGDVWIKKDREDQRGYF